MDNQNNAYFEQQIEQLAGGMSEDEIVQKISDCQLIVERLESDPVWKLVIRDATEWVDKLDSNWQEIEDDKQRNYARVLKFAYLHIRSLPSKYIVELENAKKVLETKNNKETVIPKDYDTETNIQQ